MIELEGPRLFPVTVFHYSGLSGIMLIEDTGFIDLSFDEHKYLESHSTA